MEALINALAFPHPPRNAAGTSSLRQHPSLLWLTVSPDGARVPALYVRQPEGSRRRSKRFLVLYSHGNAEDLAQLAGGLGGMARRLDADVLAYEYPGYSIADGVPSEGGCYAAAKAAYDWAVAAEGGGAAPGEVVPFGRSLGSAPACYMASTAAAPVGGLLLQSPLLSGANAMLGQMVAAVSSCLDVFKNCDRILNARCRVAIAHGTHDEVVPCWNGRRLHDLAADAHEPLWCAGRGHNDMDESEVLQWASQFLDSLHAEGPRRSARLRDKDVPP